MVADVALQIWLSYMRMSDFHHVTHYHVANK